MRQLGTVATLRRFPVKSMLGEEVSEVSVSAGGIDKDRVFALIDVETGRVASGKRPKLWRRLLECSAAWDGQSVVITLPDGREVRPLDEGSDEALSELLGRPTKFSDTRPEAAMVARPDPEAVIESGVEADVDYQMLEIAAATPGGTFVDYAPVSFFTSATLGQLGTEAVRYRPNIMVQTLPDVQPFAENDWAGREITIGSVRLRGIIPTPRCAIPMLAHGDLPRRVDAVRALFTKNLIDVPGFGAVPCAGLYAEVLEGGSIYPGDVAELV